MKLTGKQKILLHLSRVGRCRYITGQMRTEFGRNIYGQHTWLHHLFMEGMIQTDSGPVDYDAENIYANCPHGGEEIFLTEAGETKVGELLQKIEG